MFPQAEADLAAALFQELRTFLLAGKAPPAKTYTVGVITPYKQQAAVLRRTFRELVGDEAAAEVWWRLSESLPGRRNGLAFIRVLHACRRSQPLSCANWCLVPSPAAKSYSWLCLSS